MITTTPLDVNNNRTRRDFLEFTLPSTMEGLSEQTRPLWGKMTAQNMVEHLIWTFELSTGKSQVDYTRPDNLTERARRFLYDNRPTPQLFKNPLLGENAPPLRFESLADSKIVLHKELNRFFNHFLANQTAIHNHPIFGPLGAEDWERTQYKHCYHHLLQFGLIIERKNVDNSAAP